MVVTELEGQNVEFTTRILKKETQTSSKSNNIDDINGEIINFKVSEAKRDNLGSTASITGTALDTQLKHIGSWSWEEKKPAVCMICKLAIKEGQNASRCPMCHSLFHEEHVFEWLKVKGKCPVCLQGLRPGGTEVVKL